MANLRVLVTIPRDTGLPEDEVTNTFHFVAAAESATYNNIFSNISGFYSELDEYLNGVVASPITITIYNLADATPRVPVATGDFAITPGATSAVPEEASAVLSFQGDPVSGVPQARRRGRIYFGPLASNAIVAVSGRVQLDPLFLADAVAALSTLEDAMNADGITWVVYSTTGETFTPVTNGWVDNAIDTQRRRGTAATARSLWS